MREEELVVSTGRHSHFFLKRVCLDTQTHTLELIANFIHEERELQQHTKAKVFLLFTKSESAGGVCVCVCVCVCAHHQSPHSSHSSFAARVEEERKMMGSINVHLRTINSVAIVANTFVG
jgi:hypothetical protein